MNKMELVLNDNGWKLFEYKGYKIEERNYGSCGIRVHVFNDLLSGIPKIDTILDKDRTKVIDFRISLNKNNLSGEELKLLIEECNIALELIEILKFKYIQSTNH